jgi:hypothetical protein
MDGYKNVKVDFDGLNESSLIWNEAFTLNVFYKGVQFDFFLKLNQKYDVLMCIGSGYVERQKIQPPVFHRYSWSSEIQASTIFYADPTLYLDDEIGLGWGQGVEDHFYLRSISDILKKIAEITKYEYKNMLFYGSSAGGYQSLYLAGYFRGSRALVNNPQTNIFNYHENHVNKMLSVSYKGLDLETIKKKYGRRLVVMDFYKSIKYVPKIAYYQNIAATHDINNHLTPFFNELNKLKILDKGTRIAFHMYYDQEKGHNPHPKEQAIKIINQTIRKFK